jgi:hypothetical protein
MLIDVLLRALSMSSHTAALARLIASTCRRAKSWVLHHHVPAVLFYFP